MATIVNIGSAPNDGTGDPIRTAFGKINDNFPYVTPEQYDAAGDGSTNDQVAIQNAVNSGFPVYFGPKNYRVNTTVIIPSNVKLYGCGAATTISTTSNISIFTIQGKNSTIKNIRFLGNSTGAAQRGVDVTGNAGLTLDYSGNKLFGCFFENLNHAGTYATLVLGASSSEHKGALHADTCYALNCGNGFMFADRAEYCNFVNCFAHGCTTNLSIAAGNVSFIGGMLVNGTTGLAFLSGSNDGKCIIDGVKINHNSTAVSSTGVTLGSRISNCQMIINGSVTISAAASHEFIGCQIGNAVLTITNSSVTKFISCRFQTTPTATFTGTAPQFIGCTYDSGAVQPSAMTATVVGIQRSSVTTQFDKTSNTTLSDITGLTANVRAGGRYTFRAILHTTSNVAGGVKVAIAGTATATTIIYEATVYQGGVSTAPGTARATALATAVGDITAVTTARIEVVGFILVNAAGTQTVQFAQNVSNGTASSVLVGSSFEVNESF